MSQSDSLTPAAEGSDGWIRVRVMASVLGMFVGEEHWIYPTERVELMIKCGQLLWLDEPDDDYARWEDEGGTIQGS